MPRIKTQMEVKDKILTEAFRLFCSKGIKSVSMDDIAEQLAMSKKTLYKWFENKDELVNAVIGNYLETNQCGCNAITEDAKDAVDELLTIVEYNRRIFSELHPSVFFDLQKFYPKAWSLFNEFKLDFILTKVKANICRGIKEGLFRSDLNVEVMARLRLAQIEIVFNHDIFPPGKFNVPQVQMDCLEHFLLGIATLKGHKLLNKYKQITEDE